jgi:hypothetical protein
MATTEPVDTCLHFVMKNPIAFRDFWAPKVWPEPYRHTRYYQLAPALAGSALIMGGRGWGKSKGMEFDMLQDCIVEDNTEAILTAWRRAHVQERMEAVIEWFRKEPFLNQFVPKERGRLAVRRQPRYELHLLNGFTLYGASVGDDPMAANIQGPHPKIRYGEEFQFYPRHAWEKFQSTAHESGTRDRFYGIRDGRRDTPWWDLDTDREGFTRFKGARFAIPKLASPYYDEAQQRQDARAFGGADSSEYANQVLAEWGEPTYGIWPIKELIECMDPGARLAEHIVTPRSLTKKAAALEVEDLLAPPPEATDVILAIDPAYTEASTVMCFWKARKRWHIDWLLRMRNKVPIDEQTLMMELLWRRMRARRISIDCSGGEGRDMRNLLLSEKFGSIKFAPEQVVSYEVQVKIVIGYDVEKDAWDLPVGPETERKDTELNNAIARLRRMIHDRAFALPYSEMVIEEFNSETQKRTALGYRIVVPSNVHVPETFRVFAHAEFITEKLAESLDFGPSASIFQAESVNSGAFRGMGKR